MLPDEVLDEYTKLKLKGQKELYALELGGLFFLFRPLTFNEHETISQLEDRLDSATLSEVTVQLGVVYSPVELIEWLDNCTPSHPDVLAKAIQDASGFISVDGFINTIDSARKEADKLSNLILLYICTAFKTLVPSDVENMTLEEQARHLSLAEQLIGEPLDIQALLGVKTGPRPNIPVPEGMETTDMGSMLSPDAPGLDIPDVNKILRG
jgi:hypothetical protein